jgi:lipid-binding SYLF domain-containing protein
MVAGTPTAGADISMVAGHGAAAIRGVADRTVEDISEPAVAAGMVADFSMPGAATTAADSCVMAART